MTNHLAFVNQNMLRCRSHRARALLHNGTSTEAHLQEGDHQRALTNAPTKQDSPMASRTGLGQLL